MLFSDRFKIVKNGSEDWFNPILDDDTLLFVDPFLIYLDNTGLFQGAYQKIMDFFSKVFEEAANVPYNVKSPRFKVLMSRVIFKEPREACLGFSIGSVDGAGSGSGFAKNTISAIYQSINAGIINLNHFEELGIFNANIKEDRISDTAINILKEEFIAYSQSICNSLNIPLSDLPCRVFDQSTNRWVVRKYRLPRNPFNNGPIILIPKRFLASINALNSEDFFDYCWEQFDDSVKDQLNVEIKSNVDKKKIVEIARNNPDWVAKYLKFKEDEDKQNAYDLENDPAGVYQWHKATEKFVNDSPLETDVKDPDSFISFLDELAESFRIFLEESNGYTLLLDSSSKPKREKASQLLLYGMIKHFCKAIGCKIDLKEAGKGIINFIFQSGYKSIAFLEVKYARNSELLKTFDSFLQKTNYGDEIVHGYYFVIGFKFVDVQKGLELEDDLLGLAEEYNFRLKYKTIDLTIN
ncbi:hypothetical protein [Mucilaginibacter sp.]|uniref:hypothetical protein n=1 Tax=Mucilaginibacter sp. TaxID=1882438 RepID=UPI0025ECB4CB|nr:hypothetical protein [Mucilaginibacter sp.]